MTYEVLYAISFEAPDDDHARRRISSIMHRLGDIARNEHVGIDTHAFVDEKGRNVPLIRPAPERPALIDPETSRAIREEIRLRLESSALRPVRPDRADAKDRPE